jgi:hypothetical protein
MRHLPDFEPFPNHLIDDMHKAFDVVCAKLRLTPQPDKATALVITKIVDLAKTGRRGDDLTDETLRFFEPERLTDGHSPTPKPALDVRSGG